MTTVSDELLTVALEALERPVGMQDVRLAVGEGPLTPAHVLAGVNAEFKRRAAMIRSSRLARADAAVRVPEGMVLVPLEPTETMAYNGGIAFEDAFFANQSHVFDAAKDAYRIMVRVALAASPQPTAKEPEHG